MLIYIIKPFGQSFTTSLNVFPPLFIYLLPPPPPPVEVLWQKDGGRSEMKQYSRDKRTGGWRWDQKKIKYIKIK